MMAKRREPHLWVVAHEPRKALSVHAFSDTAGAVDYIVSAKAMEVEREHQRHLKRVLKKQRRRRERKSAAAAASLKSRQLSSHVSFAHARPLPVLEPVMLGTSSLSETAIRMVHPPRRRESLAPGEPHSVPPAAAHSNQLLGITAGEPNRNGEGLGGTEDSQFGEPSTTPANGHYTLPQHSWERASVGTTTSSDSSSGEEASDSDDDEGRFEFVAWLDIQTNNEAQIRQIIGQFPVREAIVRQMFQRHFQDTVHAQTADAYVFAIILVAPVMPRDQDGADLFVSDDDDDGATLDRLVPLYIIAFPDWVITVHSGPVRGLAETLALVQSTFSGAKRRRRALSSVDALSAAGGSNDSPQALLVAWLFGVLVDFVVMAVMPDTIRLLNDAKAVDEIILTTPESERHDLLRRFSRVRTRIAAERTALASKERILHQLSTAPMVRASCLGRKVSIDQLEFTHRSVGYVASRIDAAADVLTEANNKFVNHLSLQMTSLSTRMNRTMKALSQIATVALPLNVITGLFGMNVTVPFQTGLDAAQYSLRHVTPFLGIVCGMLLYTVIGFQLVYRSLARGLENDRRYRVDDVD